MDTVGATSDTPSVYTTAADAFISGLEATINPVGTAVNAVTGKSKSPGIVSGTLGNMALVAIGIVLGIGALLIGGGKETIVKVGGVAKTAATVLA